LSQESSFIGNEIDEVDCGSNTDLRETNRLMANKIDEVDCGSDLDLRETDRLMAEEVDCGIDIDLRETNCLVNDQREFHCATYEFDIYYTDVSTMTQLSFSAPP